MNERERAVLQAAPLFSDLSETQFKTLAALLQMSERRYPRGSCLIAVGDPIPAFGMVLSGAVQVSMDDVDGNHIVMANVAAGALFAEALACSNTTQSPICAMAMQDSVVLWFHSDRLLSPDFFTDPVCARFGINFIRAVTARALRFNDRVQVLSKKSIRAKLVTFFSHQVQLQKSKEITLAMDRNGLADYLGVERSALSRELSRMRSDGLIDFHKNHFTIYHG